MDMGFQHSPGLHFHPPGRGAVYGPGGTLRYCIGHAPGAQDARRKGGHAASRAERAGKLLPARLQPMVSLLEDALGEVHRGELDPQLWPVWPVFWCGPLRPVSWRKD